LGENQTKNLALLKSNLTQEEGKLEKLEMKFIEGKLDSETYEKHRTRFTQEIHEIRKRIENESNQISNPSELLDFCFHLIQNIADLWQKSRINEKRKLLKLLFPEGMFYSKRNDALRTERLNEIIRVINSISVAYDKNLDADSEEIEPRSALVAPAGH